MMYIVGILNMGLSFIKVIKYRNFLFFGANFKCTTIPPSLAYSNKCWMISPCLGAYLGDLIEQVIKKL